MQLELSPNFFPISSNPGLDLPPNFSSTPLNRSLDLSPTLFPALLTAQYLAMSSWKAHMPRGSPEACAPTSSKTARGSVGLVTNCAAAGRSPAQTTHQRAWLPTPLYQVSGRLAMLAVAMLALALGSFTVFAAAVTPALPLSLQPPTSNQGRRLLLVLPAAISTDEMLRRLEAAEAIEGKEFVFRYRMVDSPPGIKMTITRPESVEDSLSAAPVLNYFTAQKFMQGANLAKLSGLNSSAVNALRTVQLINSAKTAPETTFDTIVRTVGDQVKVRVVRNFEDEKTALESQIDVPPMFDYLYNDGADKHFWEFLNCDVNMGTGKVAWDPKKKI
eukprot:GHVT01012592.1.p1 GENE.GHVT01012592.1~~GHVT01012592.1.p1  ORF type:complete len:331 (+),score=32.82 GHVT01012592.1:501-1493(+)